MAKPKKTTQLEKGILLAVVWLARDKGDWTEAAELAKTYGVHRRDVSDHAEFDRETYAWMNEHEGCSFHLSNTEHTDASRRE